MNIAEINQIGCFLTANFSNFTPSMIFFVFSWKNTFRKPTIKNQE